MSTHERWLEELWDEEDRLAAAAEELEATEERKAAERKATEERNLNPNLRCRVDVWMT